jgi:multidrug resistance efflux pump
MKKRLIFVGILLPFILIASACSPKTEEVKLVTATPQAESLIAEGRVRPVNSLDNSFTVSGQVEEVLVADGGYVEAGQVLATLKGSMEAQVSVSRASQEVLLAQQALDDFKSLAAINLAEGRLAVFERQKELEEAQKVYDQDSSEENQVKLEISQENLELAENLLVKLEAGKGLDSDQLAVLQAGLESATLALSNANELLAARKLTANMDGTVVDLSLQAGQQIQAGQPVLILADFSKWVVETDNLTENDVVNVHEGQQVEIVFDSLPEVTLTGEVIKIAAKFEEKRGDITYTATVLLAQTDPQIRWGMTAAIYFLP